MITFIPRDIGMWRNHFDFTPTILAPPRKYFHDRDELIQFLKEAGVKLDDAQHPLEFVGPKFHHTLGNAYDIIQWSLIGWMKDDYV